MVIGIILGFGAAFSQSISFLFSRMFTARFKDSYLQLLAASHILMAVLSLIVFPFVKPAQMPPFSSYWLLVFICIFGYLLGQTGLLLALTTAPASRVSPLLGLKVFLLALVGALLMNQNFTPLQWFAIAMSIIAAFLLSRTGEKLPAKSMGWIIFAVVTFSLSDIYIKKIVTNFEFLGFAKSAIISVCLCYIACGFFGLALLKFIPRPTARMWPFSAPFALAWFVSMLFLFGCFAHIGFVFGTIVQSTRGIISILFVPFLVRAGYEHLETKTPRPVFFARLAAALLMTAAIALYYLSR